MPATDWTCRWRLAAAVALSAHTRGPLLGRAREARSLRACLQDVVTREDLPLLGWVILPDGLHLIGARGGRVPWPVALGRIKQAFSRRSRAAPRATGRASPIWRTDVKVRPLSESDLPRALRALHEMPVRAGLCPGPDDWDWSSWRHGARTPVNAP